MHPRQRRPPAGETSLLPRLAEMKLLPRSRAFPLSGLSSSRSPPASAGTRDGGDNHEGVHPNGGCRGHGECSGVRMLSPGPQCQCPSQNGVAPAGSLPQPSPGTWSALPWLTPHTLRLPRVFSSFTGSLRPSQPPCGAVAVGAASEGRAALGVPLTFYVLGCSSVLRPYSSETLLLPGPGLVQRAYFTYAHVHTDFSNHELELRGSIVSSSFQIWYRS